MIEFKTIYFRRDTAAIAAANDELGHAGEPGFETDTGVFKIYPDNATSWNSIPLSHVYASQAWTIGNFVVIGGALGTPSSGTLTNCTGLPQSGVLDLTTDLAAKAPLASPTFTGPVTLSELETPVSAETSSFVTMPSGGTRNNHGAMLGFEFLAVKPATINALGRRYISGNVQDHRVSLWDMADTTTPVATGIVLAASASDANGVKRVSVTPYTLIVGHTYTLACAEPNGGDTWYDLHTPSLTNILTVRGSRYGNSFAGDALTAMPVNYTADGNMYSSATMFYQVQDDLIVDAPLVANGTVKLPNLTNYANNAAAVAAGLPVGALYRTGGAVMQVI